MSDLEHKVIRMLEGGWTSELVTEYMKALVCGEFGKAYWEDVRLEMTLVESISKKTRLGSSCFTQ